MTDRQAIVVLGCRVLDDGRPSASLSRRAAWALAAHSAKMASWIVTSGGRRWAGHSEASVLADLLEAGGAPRERILRELCSLTTVENALFTAALFRRHGLTRAVLVTCGWHMPRAAFCFRQAGIEVLPVPAPAPPASVIGRVRRRVHEAVSMQLDRAQLRRVASGPEREACHPFVSAEDAG